MPKLLIATSVPSTLTAFLLPFARHFRDLGWQVDAAANGATQNPRVREAFDAVHDLPWTRSPGDIAINLVQSPRQLRALAEQGGYDLVHAHDPIAAFVTRLALRRARRRLGFKVVYTAHGFHFFRGASPTRYAAFRALEEVAAAWTDALIVINREDEAAARRFVLLPSRRVTYMPGIGVDLSHYDVDRVPEATILAVREELGMSAGEQLLLMIAEFNPGKRHLDAVAALARSERSDVVLAFAGEGPEMERVRAAAHAHGIGSRVHLLGYRRDIQALIAASFATILPSEREGLPRAIMESLAMHRPVIATRIRGVSELVSQGTGAIVDVGDVEGLAAAIRRFAADPVTTAEMGRQGRASMLAFDLQQVLALHENLYAALLQPSQPAVGGGAQS